MPFRSLSLLVAMFALTSVCAAQTDERLNARKAQFLLIDFDSSSTKIRYRLGPDDDFKDLRQPFTFTGGRESVVAWLSYRNPLRVSWVLSEKVTDDPMALAIGKFVASVNAFFATPFEVKTEAEKKDSARAPTPGMSPNQVQLLNATNVSGIQAPPPLLAWALFASQHLYCIDTERIKALETALGVADRLLYNAEDTRRLKVVDTIGTLGELRAMIKLVVTLLGAESYEPKVLLSNAALADQGIVAVEEYVKRATTAISSVPAALAKVKRVASECSPFYVYSDNAFRAFDSEARGNLKLREQMSKDLRALHTLFEARLATNPADRGFRVGEIEATPSKVKDVTITFTRRSLKVDGDKLVVSDDKAVSGTVRVAPFERWFVEFAPGVAYTNVRIQKFGTSTNGTVTTVALGGRETNPIVGTGMLNVIRSWEDGGSVWPMLQAGFAVGKVPMLLAGAGMRVTRPDNFSVGVGVAMPWIKQLNTLKVGDLISGTADLERDYVQGFARKPGFYVSVQRSF
jgi:hypothetical protein